MLFAPFCSIRKLSYVMDINSPDVVDFDSNTKVDDWLCGHAANWYKYLPDMSKFDRVVSDNLIEILYLRPDAFISGSFFWHEAIPNFPSELRDNCRELLTRIPPKIISSKIFSSSYLKGFSQLFEVGLYGENRAIKEGAVDKRRCALISCGKGGGVVRQAKSFVKNIETSPFTKVFVEPEVLPSNPPEWMLPATYTKAMYKEISVAIIRPGLGTVTDALLSMARIFSFFEKGNLELIHNSMSIYENGLGGETSTIEDAWEEACDYIDNIEQRGTHQNNIAKLSFKAEKQAVDIILS